MSILCIILYVIFMLMFFFYFFYFTLSFMLLFQVFKLFMLICVFIMWIFVLCVALIFNCYLLIYFVYMNPQKIAKKRKFATSQIRCLISYFGTNYFDVLFLTFSFFYVFCHVMWYYCYLSYFPQTCIKNNKIRIFK